MDSLVLELGLIDEISGRSSFDLLDGPFESSDSLLEAADLDASGSKLDAKPSELVLVARLSGPPDALHSA